ncbi:MAG: redox-sensing transcriptional repressor Rex [Spirochaetaceae bacterium]|nr:MAG: redox-sensing transcriptional repressor Rex [Spirochaetaceae bacterium]
MKDHEKLKKPKSTIPVQTLRRIPYYHQILSELEQQGEQFVSSKYLAHFFHVDDTQVRKDVSVIGYKGKPKSGYSVTGLKSAIGDFLGINTENTAILIGAGKLGSALIEYPGLSEYGLRLVAVFDNDPKKLDKAVGGFAVQPMENLKKVVQSFDVGIAIITVPKTAAQAVCDLVAEQKIKAIWNFAPTQLSAPSDVTVRNENMAVGLALLSHYLKKRTAESAIFS